MKRKTKVVVVGAGIAGITSAVKLIKNGIQDVVILEAQDKVGGRINTVLLDGKPLDMGATFIHGSEGNPIYQIAKKIGKVVKEDDGLHSRLILKPHSFYTTQREKIPIQDVEGLIDALDECGDKIAGENVSKGECLQDCYEQFLQEHANESTTNKEIFDAAYRWYCKYEGIDEGTASLFDLAAWSIDKYKKFPGYQYTEIVGGYESIINALLSCLPDGVVHTQMPVDSIHWSDPRDGSMVVRCSNGDEFIADHVIVTISLGCLKAVQSTMFQPPLPTMFRTVINSMEMGSIGKVFLKWDTLFWKDKDFGPRDSKELLWLASHHLTLKQDKSKKKTQDGKFWWQDIPNVERVTGRDDLLLMWFLSPQMKLINTLDEVELMAILHAIIQFFFFDLTIPAPSSVYRTSWESNPYTQGTYSYITLSFDPDNIKYLSQPVFNKENPRLLFAGEAFKVDYMTTTHGAFISGEEQADEVLRFRGITDTTKVVDLI